MLAAAAGDPLRLARLDGQRLSEARDRVLSSSVSEYKQDEQAYDRIAHEMNSRYGAGLVILSDEFGPAGHPPGSGPDHPGEASFLSRGQAESRGSKQGDGEMSRPTLGMRVVQSTGQARRGPSSRRSRARLRRLGVNFLHGCADSTS